MSGSERFTPGPWVLSDEGAKHSTLRVRHGNEYGKALATVHMAGAPEQRPNARLIAAAPELYEALENLVSQCADDFATEEQLLRGHGATYVEAIMRGRRALSRARGDQ